MTKSCNQEFIDAVRADDTTGLGRRLRAARCRLYRESRWGDAASQARHIAIIKNEIKRRILRIGAGR